MSGSWLALHSPKPPHLGCHLHRIIAVFVLLAVSLIAILAWKLQTLLTTRASPFACLDLTQV